MQIFYLHAFFMTTVARRNYSVERPPTNPIFLQWRFPFCFEVFVVDEKLLPVLSPLNVQVIIVI